LINNAQEFGRRKRLLEEKKETVKMLLFSFSEPHFLVLVSFDSLFSVSVSDGQGRVWHHSSFFLVDLESHDQLS
jgi:hypothetical protein